MAVVGAIAFEIAEEERADTLPHIVLLLLLLLLHLYLYTYPNLNFIIRNSHGNSVHKFKTNDWWQKQWLGARMILVSHPSFQIFRPSRSTRRLPPHAQLTMQSSPLRPTHRIVYNVRVYSACRPLPPSPPLLAQLQRFARASCVWRRRRRRGAGVAAQPLSHRVFTFRR